MRNEILMLLNELDGGMKSVAVVADELEELFNRELEAAQLRKTVVEAGSGERESHRALFQQIVDLQMGHCTPNCVRRQLALTQRR